MAKCKILEYLDIVYSNNGIIYTATVINQNKGIGIEFKNTSGHANTLIFENPNHVFPKLIKYRKTSKNQLTVTITDRKQKEYSYINEQDT